MLNLSSVELSMIRVSIRTRISAIEVGLPGNSLSDVEKKEVIERYERLLSALCDFASEKTADSQTVLIEVLNTPNYDLRHENREN